ncbi:MAG: glyoxalase/bleomycin resistance protein/dioxygenase [Actinomycetia bacterium]|nr:glyoxalase/bleomycin resistance protein/dioxygenase [Actinomycetes bacterium]
MTITNVLTNLHVSDAHAATAWYEQLFGREPDRRPMDGLVEWQLATTGGVQVFDDPESTGGTTVVLTVDDMDAHVADLGSRGITLVSDDVPGAKFRVATVDDPSGNTIVFIQPN